MTGDSPRTWPKRPRRLRPMAYASAAMPTSDELSCEGERELRVGDEVATGKPARLEQQAIAPLEPGTLHPVGRAALRAGDELEHGADAEHQRCVDQAARGRHPLLLPRRAEA